MTKKQIHFSFLVIFGQFRLLHGKKGKKTLLFWVKKQFFLVSFDMIFIFHVKWNKNKKVIFWFVFCVIWKNRRENHLCLLKFVFFTTTPSMHIYLVSCMSCGYLLLLVCLVLSCIVQHPSRTYLSPSSPICRWCIAIVCCKFSQR